MLRTIGFSASPGVLLVLGIIPVLGVFVSLVVSIWMLAAFVVAVRQALDYRSTGRAVAVCAIGWLFFVALSVVLRMFVGGGGPG